MRSLLRLIAWARAEVRGLAAVVILGLSLSATYVSQGLLVATALAHSGRQLARALFRTGSGSAAADAG